MLLFSKFFILKLLKELLVLNDFENILLLDIPFVFFLKILSEF